VPLLERTKRLIETVRQWCDDQGLLQKSLASQLGMSPQALNEIFQERNNPSSETTLHLLELLRNDMTNRPKTLTLALEKIDQLTAEINELKTGKPATKPNAPEPPEMTAWDAELARVEKASKAGLSTKPLSEQSLPELRAALANEPDSAKRNQIYKMVKAAERELFGPKPVARFHGV
jgi:transcriptional regulator with XRE-family HTH domain